MNKTIVETRTREVSIAEKVELQARYNTDALMKVARRVELEGAAESVIVSARARAAAADLEWKRTQDTLNKLRITLQKANRRLFIATKRVETARGNCAKA